MVLVIAAMLAACSGDDGAPDDSPGEEATVSAPSGEADAHPARVTPDSFVDAAGVTHTFREPATRIVSLVPSATETIHALGADVALVGRTDYDTDDWSADIASVGGGLDPNLEAIVALSPDLVIRFEGEQDPRTPERLDELGIRHVAERPVRLDDIFTTTSIVGMVTGRREAADSISRSIRAGLAVLREEVATLPRMRVAYVLGGSPPWVSGPDTYIVEVLDLVGGDNVFDDLGASYASVSPEELRTRQIDVVLVSSDEAMDTSLVPGARFELIGADLESPGPGVVDAARSVAQAMHGQRLR
jgi:ABC-type Fe3+-hydroxamate transport system substrate-binding protein